MAYAAAISFVDTIERLLHCSRISIVSPSREILEFAQEEVNSLQEVLKGLDKSRSSSQRMKVLEGEMREAVCKLEDVIESHVSDQFLSQSEECPNADHHPLLFSLDLQELRQDIDCFTEAAKKMEEEYIKELDNLLPEEEDGDAVSSRTDFAGNKSNMVGLTDEFCEIRDELVNLPETIVLSIVGMAGIGKTTLAKKIFEDPLILRNFECRAFVRVGQKYQLQEILQDIRAQLNPNSHKMLMEGDENLDEYFCKSLEDRRYLIVLDDLWNTDFWDDFRRRLPKEDNRNVILVTTRLEQVARSINIFHPYKVMPFLNKEDSWDLFRGKVFLEESCPPQLEKAGKKIVENC